MLMWWRRCCSTLVLPLLAAVRFFLLFLFLKGRGWITSKISKSRSEETSRFFAFFCLLLFLWANACRDYYTSLRCSFDRTGRVLRSTSFSIFHLCKLPLALLYRFYFLSGAEGCICPQGFSYINLVPFDHNFLWRRKKYIKRKQPWKKIIWWSSRIKNFFKGMFLCVHLWRVAYLSTKKGHMCYMCEQ